MRPSFLIAGVLAAGLFGAAEAQAPAAAPAPAAPGVVTTHTQTSSSHKVSVTGSSDKAARSKTCSQEADAKGLHGKARKQFRSACKQGKAA